MPYFFIIFGNGDIMKWSNLIPIESTKLALSIAKQVQKERDEGKNIFPPQNQIFRALELTPPENVKVCIIGQDPYHTQGQANGLAFSIANGNPVQPSLHNIFKELVGDIGCNTPTTSDLTPWAERGVLLLNVTLTVEEGKPNSHYNLGWHKFTTSVFQACTNLNQPVVFLVWGNFAKNMMYRIFPLGTNYKTLPSTKRKACLFSAHPSPLSANRGFFGSKPFSYANTMLEKMVSQKIDWSLP